MCGGMKFMNPSMPFTKDELTTVIDMVRKEISSRDHYLHDIRTFKITMGDCELVESIEKLEELLDKFEHLRSGYEIK